MRWILKLLQLLYCLYAVLLFVVLMIPVFLWSLLALMAGGIRSGNLVLKGCQVWADIWFFCIGIYHINHFEQPLKKGASYIFVANHISYLDAAIIPKAFRIPVRPLGKVELSKVPIFGFIYKNAIVSVDRSSPANRAKSVQSLKKILHKGVSVLVFPEGTFNLTHKPLKSFYDGAFRIAIETGTPIRPVLFLDTYDRMHYRSVFSLKPGVNRCIFLPQVEVKDYTLKDVEALKTKVYRIMEERLQHYGASWIKETPGKEELH